MKVAKYIHQVPSPIDALFDGRAFGLPSLIDRFFADVDGTAEGWSAVRLPRTNVHETDDAYVFTAEMPGLSKKDVEVNLEGDTLVIRGEKSEQHDEKGLVRREYRATRFERSFNVGGGIDRDRIKAKMDDGILTVTLPKSPEKVGRKVEIA